MRRRDGGNTFPEVRIGRREEAGGKTVAANNHCSRAVHGSILDSGRHEDERREQPPSAADDVAGRRLFSDRIYRIDRIVGGG